MKFDRIPIGKFSLMTHLTQKALRLYDQKGLLVPNSKDVFTGYRCYTYPQIERGVKIRTLSWLGFGLDDIAKLLDAEEQDNVNVIGEMMQKKYAETQVEVAKLQRIQKVLLKQTDTMEILSMSVSEPTIKEVPKLRVLSKRELGTYNDTIGKLIVELFEFIEAKTDQRGTIKVTAPVMFICHDEEFKEDDADIEVALPISGSISIDNPNVELKSLPSIKVVSVIHKGPYEEVDVAYAKLFEYMAENDLEMTSSSRAIYFNDPAEVSEDELLTEVQIPIENM